MSPESLAGIVGATSSDVRCLLDDFRELGFIMRFWVTPTPIDFNPIEKCWSKIRAGLRAAKARLLDALDQAITTESLPSLRITRRLGFTVAVIGHSYQGKLEGSYEGKFLAHCV